MFAIIALSSLAAAPMPILHRCRVTSGKQPATEFAVLFRDPTSIETYDPDDLLKITFNMEPGIKINASSQRVSVDVPSYLDMGPHYEALQHTGDLGGKIDIAFLNAQRTRSAISVMHRREPPEGETSIHKGVCEVKSGPAAITSFEKLGS